MGWALTLAGCVERTLRDGELTIGYASWIKIGTIVAVPILGIVAWKLPRSWPRWRLIAGVLSVACAVLVAPAIHLDRLVIDPKGFRYRAGNWFSPRIVAADWANVERIAIPQSETMSRHRTPITVTLRSGERFTVPQGDLLAQCIQDLVEGAVEADVRVERLR